MQLFLVSIAYFYVFDRNTNFIGVAFGATNLNALKHILDNNFGFWFVCFDYQFEHALHF